MSVDDGFRCCTRVDSVWGCVWFGICCGVCVGGGGGGGTFDLVTTFNQRKFILNIFFTLFQCVKRKQVYR